MLQKLLAEIQSGGTLEPGVLAARLGTSPQMVRVLLEHLERLGRLQPMQDCAPQNCGGCGLAASCASAPPRVWKLAG